MNLFKIVKDNNKKLKEKSVDINLPLSEDIKKLGLEMLEYLKISQNEELANKYKIRSGVGLAAPQIGQNIKLIAIYIEFPDKPLELVLVNPKIISESSKLCYLEDGEGCLSVDKEHKGYVYRHYKIKVKAYNLIDEEEQILEFKGYPSIVLQHEIDHLSGILFYDRIDKFEPFKKRLNSIVIG